MSRKGSTEQQPTIPQEDCRGTHWNNLSRQTEMTKIYAVVISIKWWFSLAGWAETSQYHTNKTSNSHTRSHLTSQLFTSRPTMSGVLTDVSQDCQCPMRCSYISPSCTFWHSGHGIMCCGIGIR